jgi:hypothetical protein
MNFITLTSKFNRKVVIRWDTIMSMEEVVAPQTHGEPGVSLTFIMYGEFGMAKTHEVYVKEPTDEIIKRIEAPYSVEIDREDTYPGLWDICENLEAHQIGPTVAVAVIQTFIENEIKIAVERAVALDRAARGDDEEETEEAQMEREESEMIDRKMEQERARKRDAEGL